MNIRSAEIGGIVMMCIGAFGLYLAATDQVIFFVGSRLMPHWSAKHFVILVGLLSIIGGLYVFLYGK